MPKINVKNTVNFRPLTTEETNDTWKLQQFTDAANVSQGHL